MRGAGVAELADAQGLGWAQTRPRYIEFLYLTGVENFETE